MKVMPTKLIIAFGFMAIGSGWSTPPGCSR